MTSEKSLFPQKVCPSLLPFASDTVSLMVRVCDEGVPARAVVVIVTIVGGLNVVVEQRSTIVTVNVASRVTTGDGVLALVIDALYFNG